MPCAAHGSGNALVAASCESGNVESADDILADGTFCEALLQVVPAFCNGCLADMVERFLDAGTAGQHPAKDEVVRDGRLVLMKDVFAAGHVGKRSMSHVCKYLINILK